MFTLDQQGETSDVCLLLEGVHPLAGGGVSSWVRDIVVSHPELTFSLLNISSRPGAYGALPYALPPNVREIHQVYCQDARPTGPSVGERVALEDHIRDVRSSARSRSPRSRVLRASLRLHLEDSLDDELLADLTSGDLTLSEFLHGRETFELVSEAAERLAPTVSFLDVFWHFRAIHVPILRLLSTDVVPARCYHAVSTGYAGLLGAAFSLKSGRPLVVTEHGSYPRESDVNLASGASLWARSFRALATFAYHRAARIITLSDFNRQRQIQDGAPAAKIMVVPSGSYRSLYQEMVAA